jgi:Neocarzinostatin family
MRHRRRLTATVAFVLAMAGLGTATPTQAQTPEAVFTVEPSTDLVDGQSISYEGTGFVPGQTYAIMQCLPGATDLTGVLTKCAIVLTDGADAAGSFSGFVTVTRTFRPLTGSQPVDCATVAGGCSVAAFDGQSTVREALVTFRDPAVPQPAITVSPASRLEDGDVVTVTGSGFPAGAAVTVAQCVVDRPTSTDWCDDRPPVSASADATGAFVAEVTVHRGITTPSGQVTDCAGDQFTPPCAIAAFTPDGAFGATLPVEFTFQRSLLAVATGPLEVSPLGTVEVTGQLGCQPVISRAVEVSGVITQTVDDRLVTEEFSVTTSCPEALTTWSTQVGGFRTQRFKVGPATVTSWAVDEADPLPDDAERLTVDVDLVRPAE